MHSAQENLRGIGWTIAYCFLVTIITIATRNLTIILNPYMAGLLTAAIAFVISLSRMLVSRQEFPRTKRRKTYLLRASAGVISYMAFAYGLLHMSIADVSAIIFTAPLFAVAMAVILYKENFTFMRAMALFGGFAGALIVIRPDGTSDVFVAMIVLISAFTYAIIHLSIKSLTQTDSHRTISFYTQFLMAIGSAPMAIIIWQTPTLESLAWALLIAICWQFNLHCMSRSHHNTDAVVVMPFQFFRLIFVIIAGVLFLGESLDLYTIIGAAIILTSAVVATRHEMRISK